MMKPIYKLNIAMILLFSITFASAQSGSMDFNLSSSSLMIETEQININSTITKTGNQLVWTQNNSANPSTNAFVITSSTGQWDEHTHSGHIEYMMDLDGYYCSLVLQGDGTTLTAVLTISPANPPAEQYVFNINGITYP